MNLIEELIAKYDINEEYTFEELSEYDTLFLEISHSLMSRIYLKLIIRELEIKEIFWVIRSYESFSGWDNEVIHISFIFEDIYMSLNQLYNKYKVLFNYQIEEYLDPSGYMCPYPNNGLEATININSAVSHNREDIFNCIKLMNSINLSTTKILYSKNKDIHPFNKNTKTFQKKAKNIKYFFAIIRALNNSAIPVYNSSIAFEKILSEVQLNSEVGLVKVNVTKKIGYSAKPYINTLKDLNILQTINDRYILDKTSKWFLEIENYIDNSSLLVSSPLLHGKEINSDTQLNLLEKYYFLKKILTIDYLYIYELFEIIYILKKSTLNEVSKLFQEKYKEYSNLEYVKGLVSLRIHWFKSLNLLDNNRNVIFTSEGLIFFEEIMKMRTLYLKIPTLTNAFLLLNFTNSFARLIDIQINSYDNIEFYIKKNISNVFTLHINKFNKRAIVSSIINTIIFLSLIEDEVALEYEEIKDIIINTNLLKELGYTFNYSVKEEDGYIKRI